MGAPINKMEQIKKLTNGKGIKYLLNEAYKIMGNPALIFDMDYRLIACPDGVVNDDPIWNEFMLSGKLGDKTIDFFKEESFIDSVANCANFDGVTYLISDKLKYERIFGQLYDKNNLPVLDLIMVACDQPFDEDTPELIAALCQVLSKELAQDEYYQEYAQRYQDCLIKKLIERDIEDKVVYAGHVSNIDRGLKTNIFVIVADIARGDSEYAKLEYFRDLFKQTQPEFKYTIYANYIVILASSDNPLLDPNKDLHKLNHLFEQENIYAGISGNFENLYEMQVYYAEAVNVLNKGLNQRLFQV